MSDVNTPTADTPEQPETEIDYKAKYEEEKGHSLYYKTRWEDVRKSYDIDYGRLVEARKKINHWRSIAIVAIAWVVIILVVVALLSKNMIIATILAIIVGAAIAAGVSAVVYYTVNPDHR